ncbi:hypothetical protein ACFSUR_28270 [Halalkalibacter alkalisediminis]|uniref:hypothetical protein n=1 Tax=Halalkalibacter alkalisediminis TaxID=935616 RepID=UPI003629AC9A
MKQIVHYLPDWEVYMQAFFVFFVPYVIWKLFNHIPVAEEKNENEIVKEKSKTATGPSD